MRSPSSLERRVLKRLADLDAAGLRRTLRPPTGIDLSSNDYLNLARHPALVGRLAQAVVREGCGSTGSRLLRGERECFEAVERRFAAFKRTERALYFGSGYLANIAVLSTLPEEGDVIFSDERNHASLIDGSRLSRARTVVFPHNDVDALSRLMEATDSSAPRFVVVESLFSMDGDFAPLAEYAALCRSAGATLIVDEAHAVGVYGADGSGLLAAIEAPEACVSINTAGKALGVAGAFVAGPAWAVEYLVQRGRPFIFTTAPPPALADALDASLTLIAAEPERRERLRSLATHVRARLAASGMAIAKGTSQIVPIVIGSNETALAVGASLQDAGFDVRAVRPPTVPPGTARLRVSINVGLDEAQLDAFVDALAPAFREAGLCSAVSS